VAAFEDLVALDVARCSSCSLLFKYLTVCDVEYMVVMTL